VARQLSAHWLIMRSSAPCVLVFQLWCHHVATADSDTTGRASNDEADPTTDANARLEKMKQEGEARREERRKEREKRRKLDPVRLANCDFSTPECWEDFYEMHPDNFDWYKVPVEFLKPHVDGLSEDLDILHVGCGSSSWTKDLGTLLRVNSVYNVDLNAAVIERMQNAYGEDKRLHFEVQDAMNLTYPNDSFNVVLDKGLLDVFRPRGPEIVVATAMELIRVLRPGGLFMYVSYSSQDRQSPELQAMCEHHAANDAHLYVCRPEVGRKEL